MRLFLQPGDWLIDRPCSQFTRFYSQCSATRTRGFCYGCQSNHVNADCTDTAEPSHDLQVSMSEEWEVELERKK